MKKQVDNKNKVRERIKSEKDTLVCSGKPSNYRTTPQFFLQVRAVYDLMSAGGCDGVVRGASGTERVASAEPEAMCDWELGDVSECV